MRHAVSFALLGAVVLLMPLWSSGCAKRVPLESGVFEAQQKVMLTLKDGRTLRGRIDADQRIDYRADGALYRARIKSVTPDSIHLGDLILVERDGSFTETATRMADGKFRITEPIPAVALSRTDVVTVELIRFDVTQTVRKAAFWAYGGALITLLLGERS